MEEKLKELRLILNFKKIYGLYFIDGYVHYGNKKTIFKDLNKVIKYHKKVRKETWKDSDEYLKILYDIKVIREFMIKEFGWY